MPENLRKNSIVINLNKINTIDTAIERVEAARTRLQSIPALMQIVRVQFARQDIKLLLRELKKTGRRRRAGEKVRWTSEKQRRYVMRLLGGRRYMRTNQLVGSWVVRVRPIATNNGSLFFLTNRKEWARFVFGAWGVRFTPKDIRWYEHFQQGFHSDMGWPLAWKPIKKASDSFIRKHQAMFNQLIYTLFDPL